MLAFAAGNLIGPLTIGRLFDTWGRKKMISGTYILSGIVLAISAELFREGHLTALTQTIWWAVVFFFASAGASAAYLTVSEIFPLEIRAQAIAIFFATAQCFGFLEPHIYGHLSRSKRSGARSAWCRASQNSVPAVTVRALDTDGPARLAPALSELMK